MEVFLGKKRDCIPLLNTYVDEAAIDTIITTDTDVYDLHTLELVLRFRKRVLTPDAITAFHEGTLRFSHKTTENRGSCSGVVGIKHVGTNPSVKSNIFGYMDKLSPVHKYNLRMNGVAIQNQARQCRYNRDYPDKYIEALPLVWEIDELYANLLPDQYALQRAKADSTYFKILDTAFTTVTLNRDFQTTIHVDKGDDADGFGNLAVIETGNYEGGHTCFPEYGIGVDVRTGDLLFMNSHIPHGNTAIVKKTPDASRLSIVCYLRPNIVKYTKHFTEAQAREHLDTLNRNIKKNIV